MSSHQIHCQGNMMASHSDSQPARRKGLGADGCIFMATTSVQDYLGGRGTCSRCILWPAETGHTAAFVNILNNPALLNVSSKPFSVKGYENLIMHG